MDRDLVVQAQRGDLGAFEALATSSHPRLFRVALGILRDADRAEDATQATMVDVWRYLPRLRDPQAFDSWSYRLLVRACSREARDVPRRLPEIESPHDRSHPRRTRSPASPTATSWSVASGGCPSSTVRSSCCDT